MILSDFEPQERLVGTICPMASLSIESILARRGQAPTQVPASSLSIDNILSIDRLSKY